MIGPCPDAKGGMASVIAIYRKNGLFSKSRCRYLTTATEGDALRKLWVAASALIRFSVMLIMQQVSLLHVHGASHGSFWRKRVFMRLACAFGVPVIFHLHGGEFRQFVDQRLDAGSRQKVLETLQTCSLIYCLNDEVAGWLRSVLSGVAVQVMPNPVDFPQEEAPRGKRDSSILFLGRLEQEKGVFDLLAAFSAIARQAPEARLLLCGVGSARAKLEKIVQENRLSSRVDFPGWVDGEEKARLLRRAGVFVLPSYAEGMPMSVLEAMASGTPVVASRVGAVPEMLENGNSGFVVEAGQLDQLAEAILAALDESRSADLSSRALARVHEFYSAKVVLDRLRWQYAKLAP
jgi:glycosyltransferase involved in cell wall biosynthesis